VYVEDISGADEPDEYGLHSKRYLACLSAMIWLAEQGYLSYESTIRQEAIDQAVLSHKGFTLLSSRCELSSNPDKTEAMLAAEMEPSRSNIVQLRRALKSRSSNRVNQTMQYLFSIAGRFH
jgi:hypothetical protein